MSDNRITMFHSMSIPFGKYEMRISNVVLLLRSSLSFEHCHDLYELHYVVKGDSILVANGERYELKEGQICWINPGVTRRVETSPFSDHQHFVIHFEFIPYSTEPPYPYEIVDFDDIVTFFSAIRKKEVWVGEGKERYPRLYNLIRNELKERKFGHMVVVRNMLCSFITAAIQDLGVMLMSESPYWTQPDNMLHSIISYIRNHYNENLTIEKVAGTLNISERHLTRLLKEKYGTTFNATLTSFRISRVQEYLSFGRASLESIAEDTGFSSVAVMSANFLKHTGQTIRQYRDSLPERPPSISARTEQGCPPPLADSDSDPKSES